MTMRRRGFLGAMFGAALAAVVDPSQAFPDLDSLAEVTELEKDFVTGEMVTGEWNHVAFVKSDNGIITYLNGTVVDTIRDINLSTDNNGLSLKVKSFEIVNIQKNQTEGDEPSSVVICHPYGATVEKIDISKDYTLEFWTKLTQDPTNHHFNGRVNDIRLTRLAREKEQLDFLAGVNRLA